MRVVLVALFLGAATGYITAPLCYPPGCTIDDNCVDNIHGVAAKCCGGKCVPTPLPAGLLVNQQCTPSNTLEAKEVCFGGCGLMSTCGSAPSKCEALLGIGCDCTASSECISNNCQFSNTPNNHTTCRAPAGSQDHGEPCAVDSECKSGVCFNLQCAGLNQGQNCTTNKQCASGLVCRQGQCQASCQLGVAGCCTKNADCLGGGARCPCGGACTTQGRSGFCQNDDTNCLITTFPPNCAGAVGNNPLLGLNNRTATCSTVNGTCVAIPGPGELCPLAVCGDGYECQLTCNSTTNCLGARTCQPYGTLAPGATCPLNSLHLCQIATCVQTNRLIGNNVGNCFVANSVPAGGNCSGVAGECQAPATICSDTDPLSNQPTCKAPGSGVVGGLCTNTNPSECPAGSACVYNSTAFVYQCMVTLPAGANCTSSGLGNVPCGPGLACVLLNQPGLFSCSIAGSCTCVAIAQVGEDCSVSAFGRPCVTNTSCIQKDATSGNKCYSWGTQLDGQQCNLTVECKGPNSRCLTPANGGGNFSCQAIVGSNCNNVNECGPSPMWDCTCDRKCAILNQPTPAPTPNPTQLDPCQTQKDAFMAVAPWRFIYANPRSVLSAVDFATSASGFLAGALQLDNATLAKYLEYLCCSSCGANTKQFETTIANGYQADCSTKTLYKLAQDKCNKKIAKLALLNCWPSATGGATSASISFGILAVIMMIVNQ